MSDETDKVRKLNDLFRDTLLPTLGKVVVTAGINAKGEGFKQKAIGAVIEFKDFTEDNDPYGEHDFGAFDLDGEKLFWKIDYYDHEMQGGSDDPADPAKTVRVLTIMLADEY